MIQFDSCPFTYSTGKNSAQTDEEKQRERQRNEREQKNAELEALHIKVSYVFFSPLPSLRNRTAE